MRPITLITIYHTGAYSVVRAFREIGLNVCAPQGVSIPSKIEAIRESGMDADVIWLHWNWIHRAPDFIWKDREVITILRDPVECAISANLRGHDKKWPQQARQWAELYRFRNRVDRWVDFRCLGDAFGDYGIGAMPRENATASAPIKELYQRRNVKAVEKGLGKQYQGLLVVWHEIKETFDQAGLADMFAESMLSDAVV